MKITKRDLQISMALIGILAAVFSYFFVFTKLQDKTAVLSTENTALTTQAAWLETIFAQQNQYMADTEKMKKDAGEIISSYDAGHSREDAIMYLYNMQTAGVSDITISNINMSNPEAVVIADTTQAAAGEVQAAAGEAAADAQSTEAAPDAQAQTAAADSYLPKVEESGIELYKVPINYGFLVSYNGLKDVVDYIYRTGGRKSMDSLTLSFDSTTGKLTGNMLMNMYFMTGTDQVYHSPEIPSMSTGVANIFRTVEAGTAGENSGEENKNGAEEAVIEGTGN